MVWVKVSMLLHKFGHIRKLSTLRNLKDVSVDLWFHMGLLDESPVLD